MHKYINSHVWYSTQKRKSEKQTQPRANRVFSSPQNDCEVQHESRLSLFPSPCSIPLSSLLFNYSFLSPPYVPPTSTHSVPSLPYVSSFLSPHLSVILIFLFLYFKVSLCRSLSRWKYRIQAAQTNDNNNSLKCRRWSSPLSHCPLSLFSSCVFLPPSFSCPSPKVAISHPLPACGA